MTIRLGQQISQDGYEVVVLANDMHAGWIAVGYVDIGKALHGGESKKFPEMWDAAGKARYNEAFDLILEP